MVGLTRNDLRLFVREHLDVDETELPSTVLDRLLSDGYHRVDNYSARWSFRQIEYTFASVIGTQAYLVSAESGNVSGITAPVASIIDVRGPDYVLAPKDHQFQRSRFDVDASNGTPAEWSRWGNSLYLWPTPDAVANYVIAGYYRGSDDWLLTDSVPDLPDEFHELIAWWALSRAYGQQDDLEASSFYREDFFIQLDQRAKRYADNQDTPPVHIYGNTPSSLLLGGTDPSMDRMRYDWEF